eukprot:s5108_g6.t2
MLVARLVMLSIAIVDGARVSIQGNLATAKEQDLEGHPVWTTTTTSITTTRGQPPAISLKEAAQRGDVAALTQHLKAGADLSAELVPSGFHGEWTAAHFAAREGHAAALKFLHEAGANLNATTKYDETPALLAALHGKAEALEALAKAGADLQKADHDAWTPAHIAAFNGHVDALRVLIQAGVNLNSKTNDGDTPADNARRNSHKEALKLILEAGGAISKKRRGE